LVTWVLVAPTLAEKLRSLAESELPENVKIVWPLTGAFPDVLAVTWCTSYEKASDIVDIRRATVTVAGSAQHHEVPSARLPYVKRLPWEIFENIEESDSHFVCIAAEFEPPNRIPGVTSALAKFTPATVRVDIPSVG
jgi:hypothetical protein